MNKLLESETFDTLVEGLRGKFYAPAMGILACARGSFRSLLIGHFEDIDRERSIAWPLLDFAGVPRQEHCRRFRRQIYFLLAKL